MEIRLLRSFVAVAEERHFGRAAERLHMAQPPLSQQIRRLEVQLGVTLLHRTTRSVELAPAGEVLLVRAREILAAVDSAVEDTLRAARGEFGRLAVGFTGSATYALLPQVAAALRGALPGVVLDLRGELLTPAQVEGLLAGTLDLGLCARPFASASWPSRSSAASRSSRCCRRAHRLAAAARCRSRSWPPSRSWSTRRISARSPTTPSRRRARPTGSCRASRSRCPRRRRSSASSRPGVGVSLVPASVRHMTVEGAVYRPLVGEAAAVELGLAWRRENATTMLERALEVVRRDLARG